MHNLSVYLVFWLPTGTHFESSPNDNTAGDANYEGVLKQWVEDLSMSQYYDIVTQYGDPTLPSSTVSLAGWTVDTSPYPHAGTQADPLGDRDIQNEASRAASLNGWTEDANHVYAVFTSDQTQECLTATQCSFAQNGSAANSFCSYHSSFPDLNHNGDTVIYIGALDDDHPVGAGAVCTLGPSVTKSPNALVVDSEVSTFAHEASESVTDPILSAWTTLNNVEIADPCAYMYGPATNSAGANLVLNGRSYVAQELGSNAVGTCALDYCPTTMAKTCPPNLTFSNFADPQVASGGEIHNRFVVSNPSSTDVATSVSVSDTLPASESLVSATPPPTSQVGQNLQWSLPDLAVNDSKTISFTTSWSGPTGPDNCASVSYSDALGNPQAPSSPSCASTSVVSSSAVSVSQVSPSSGPTLGGTVVTIQGAGFSTTPGGTTFSVGTNAGSSVVCGSTTSCTATAPPGTPGTSDIVATVGSASSNKVLADQFTYVGQTSTTTSLVSSVNPSVVGQPVSYLATVSPPPDGGTVDFTQDGNPLCSGVPLNSQGLAPGQVECDQTYPSSGSHAIVAKYSSDTNYSASTSSTLNQSIGKASTSTSVASSANPSTVGAQVTYTASVSVSVPGSGTPSGTVSFSDNGSPLAACQGVAVGGGTATCAQTYSSRASHSITATYSGDTNFGASMSNTLSQSVEDLSSTSVASTPNPSTTGQQVTYTASVSATPPASGTPSGKVAFSDNGSPIPSCQSVVLVAGSASCTQTYPKVQSHSITASYSGDTNFAPSTSTVLVQTVNPDSTGTSVMSSANPSTTGEQVTYTATVTAAAPGSGVPSGSVSFNDGGSLISSCQGVTLVAGTASCTQQYGSVGSHSIIASYSGDPDFGASASSGLVENVKMDATITAVTSSVDPAATGQAVTFTATVAAAAPGSGVPSGSVSFNDGGSPISSCQGIALVAGTATCASSFASSGNHPIVAAYSGDPNFVTSASPPLTQSIGSAPGYWEAASDGGLFAFGAPFHGSMGGRALNAPVVGMAYDPATGGYWEVAADGGLFAFGAPFLGSMGGRHLNAPIVGMAYDPATGGYWEVASDGGLFAFGAPFLGSMGGRALNAPVAGMAYDPATGGYWEVAFDGGLFAFGAPFHGSMGGRPLNAPVVGMAYDPATGGYWEVASDGGLFAFGAPFFGSMGGRPLNAPVVGMAIFGG